MQFTNMKTQKKKREKNSHRIMLALYDTQSPTSPAQSPARCKPAGPSSTGSASPKASTGSKLRDSCHACAVSKVKCPKEKPACSKCEARGVQCQYFFARRPGRRSEKTGGRRPAAGARASSPTSASNGNAKGEGRRVSKGRDGTRAARRSFADWDVPGAVSPPGNYLGTPPSSTTDDVFAMGNSADYFSAHESSNVFPGLTGFDADVDDMDFVMSTMDGYPFDMLVLDSGSVHQKQHGAGALLFPAEPTDMTVLPRAAPSSTETMDDTPPELSSKSQVLAETLVSVSRASDTTSCGCLVQALGLLNTLCAAESSTSSSLGTTLSTNEPRDAGGATTPTVLAENKRSIQAVSNKLACLSCGEDSFLLTVLFMVIMKILEKYARVARARTPNDEALLLDPAIRSASGIGQDGTAASDLERVEEERRTRQLVLGELHRVQRVVNSLSMRLRAPEERDGPIVGHELEYWASYGKPLADEAERSTGAPFSAGTLERMESDVRQSLSGLSAKIISDLRQR